ncbi:hypothetical protein SITYG_10730 [Streptococcus intermedius]|uniref:Uncharacterized protein n=1 Tax=Streptococcus intermedius TaxID=1338 RepID=A0AAD1C9F5_STRIT|nr:hypothetical protein SITYG_10730 [Streptococcus intermedius]
MSRAEQVIVQSFFEKFAKNQLSFNLNIVFSTKVYHIQSDLTS